MSSAIENIIASLLLPNQQAIEQATRDLKIAIKDPSIVSEFGRILSQCENLQVRQYAAILLRRRILKKKQWRQIPPDVQSSLRQNILAMLFNEPEQLVRKALAQVIGTVVKHDAPQNKWPEFFTFIEQAIHSENVAEREVGTFTLSIACSEATSQLQPHLDAILQLSSHALDDTESVNVRFYATQTLTNMVFAVGTENAKQFQVLIPKVVALINGLIETDQAKACTAMEIFDELVESEVMIIVPHIKDVIEFCLQIGANKNLSPELRTKGLNFVTFLTKLKRKTIVKLKLTEPILKILFPIMCEPLDDTDDDDYDDVEASSPPSIAAQVIDSMAQNLPPEKFMPILFSLIEPAVTSVDENQRRAALLAMAVSAEGCADYIMSKCLKQMLGCICKAVNDPVPQVRSAALFSIGQFSEFLQPSISKYSDELLPLLFQRINLLHQSQEQDKKALTKCYYALEMFMENLEGDILPYLPGLMEHLLNVLSSNTSSHNKQLAVSLLGSTANAAEEHMAPYFPSIIENLKGFLISTKNEEDSKLQLQSLDTLAVLARKMNDHFKSLAPECLLLGLSLLKDATDPDLKRCTYGLFGAIAALLKDEMVPHLNTLVDAMIDSIKSAEGITAHIGEESSMFKVFDVDSDEEADDVNEMGDVVLEDVVLEEDDDDDDDEDDGDIQGYSVNNAYFNEKEDACTTLGELAIGIGSAFVPYIDWCFREVLHMTDSPSEEVKRSAIHSLVNLVVARHKDAEITSSLESKTAVADHLQSLVPILLQLAREDQDRQVAMDALDGVRELLQKVGAGVLSSPATTEAVMLHVQDTFKQKMASQDDSVDTNDDDQAEFDGMLEETAGDLVPAVAKVIGGQAFAPYLMHIVPFLVKKLKKNSCVADKSFALGILGETIQNIGESSVPFSKTLLPLFLNHAKDEDDEVRSNAIFALGVLVASGNSQTLPYLPDTLKCLSNTLNKEQERLVIDNICAAFCRLLKTFPEHVPTDQVLHMILPYLPLEEDHDEDVTVYSCLAQLYHQGNLVILNLIPQLLSVFAKALIAKTTQDEARLHVMKIVQAISQNHNEIFIQTVSALPSPQPEALQQCLNPHA